MKPIILASSSPYRKELLGKTGLEFLCRSPGLDEDRISAELQSSGAPPEKIAETLSYRKAKAVHEQARDALVIGGDQLVVFDGLIFGKPADHENAFRQLSLLNGRSHSLVTCVTLLDSSGAMNFTHTTRLQMKRLSSGEISRYLQADQPYDCAGSYKIESKGLVLFAQIDCDDFTAIQGMPMLWLSNRLKERGYEFF